MMAVLVGCGGAAIEPPDGALSADASAADVFLADASSVDGRPTAGDIGVADGGSGLVARLLSAVGGAGSGDYLPGDSVHVFADITPTDEAAFDGWTGDFDRLGLKRNSIFASRCRITTWPFRR